MWLGCKYFSFFSIIRGISRWWGRRCCRAGYASLLSVCTNYARRFSMPDETVEIRPPWLDFSLPRRPCLGISVLYSIILQTLNSCAIRPPDSTACPHHRLTPLTLRYMCWSSPAVRTSRRSQPACGKLKSSTASHSTQLNSPDGMQCVLKEIMNCHEVPYSLITQKAPAYPQSIRTWARG